MTTNSIKIYIFIILSILVLTPVYGQKVERLYWKGCLYQVNSYSIFKRSYVQMTYYVNCEENNSIESKGPFKKFGFDNVYRQNGFWQYWYKNGQLKEEVIYNGKSQDENKWINQWTEKGEQLLIDGNGLMFEVDKNISWTDSTVFTIDNFKKSGEFKIFRKLENTTKYYIYEQGYCEALLKFGHG